MTERKQENGETEKGKDGRGSGTKILICVGGKVFGINDIFKREK